jgi:hypothetical protein
MVEGEFNKLVEKMVAIRTAKNHDYGNSFMESYNDPEMQLGNYNIFFDINRKVGRIKVLLLGSKQPKVLNETLEDTFLDLAVISLNAILALRSRKDADNNM